MGGKLQSFPCRAIPNEKTWFSSQIRKTICLCSEIPHVMLMLLVELQQYKISVTEKRWALLQGKMVRPYSSALGTQYIVCIKPLDKSYSQDICEVPITWRAHGTVPAPAAF